MAEVLVGRRTHGQRHACLGNLLDHVLEDVFDVLKTQRVANNLPEQQLWHVTKQNFVFTHECLVKNLVDLVVW